MSNRRGAPFVHPHVPADAICSGSSVFLEAADWSGREGVQRPVSPRRQRNGPRRGRARRQSVSGARRASDHQRSRHVHHHWGQHRAARSAGRQDAGQSATCAPGRARGCGRKAAGRVDRCGVGNGERRLFGGDLSRHGGVSGGRQPRDARPSAESHRLSQRRGHHSYGVAQSVRRRGESAWREDHRGRLARVASARAWAEDRDDLHHGGPVQRNGSDVHRSDFCGREGAATSRCSWMRPRRC